MPVPIPIQRHARDIQNNTQAQNEFRVNTDDPVGRELRQAGSAVEQFGLQLGAAKSQAQAAESNLELRDRLDKEYRALEIDTDDPELFEQRFSEASAKAVEELGGRISGSRMRGAWGESAAVEIQGYVERVRTLSRTKQVDQTRAIGVRVADQYSKSAADVAFPLSQVEANRDDYLSLLRQQRATGIIDAETFEVESLKADNVYALGVSTRHVANVDAMLDGGRYGEAEAYFKANDHEIDPQEREAVEALIRGEAVEGQAVGIVDDVIARGLSRADARREFRDIENVELRNKVEQRFDYEARQREAEETDAQTNIIERYHMDIRTGKMRVSNLPREELQTLTAGQVSALASLENSAFSAPIKTDRAALAQVYDLIDAGDMGVARRFVLDNSGRFSDGDFEQYLGKTASDTDSVQIESVRSLNQVLTQVVTDAGITDKSKASAARGEIHAQVDAWQMGIQRNESRKPTDAELQEKARELSTKFILTQSDWNPFTGTRKGRLYEGLSINDVPDEHLNAVLSAFGTGGTVRIEQSDVREIYGEVMKKYKAAGVSDPSPEEIRNGVEYMRQQNAD